MRTAWTEQEEHYMNLVYIRQPVEKTAAHLGRTMCSVKRKASNMGLSHYAGEKLNARTIAGCFNSDVSVVLRWIHKFGLHGVKVICKNQTRYCIDAGEFWEWAYEHKDIINWNKYESKSLLPEPEWVVVEKTKMVNKNHRKKITEMDILTINNLLRKGKTYREIALELGRTYDSIKHIIRNKSV